MAFEQRRVNFNGFLFFALYSRVNVDTNFTSPVNPGGAHIARPTNTALGYASTIRSHATQTTSTNLK